MNHPAITTEGISKYYGDMPALREVSLQVQSQQIYGFLGPNGAGKTTLIKILVGLIRPSAGSITFFGKSYAAGPRVRRRLGALVESPAFLGYLSGRRHLQILARLYTRDTRAEVERVLDLVQLSEWADYAVRGYSLGMRQRLGIAQALLFQPELLVLDEPTNGLDPQGIADVRGLLLRLNRETGITLFISSHMLAELEQICTHVGLIHRGKLLVSDAVGQLSGDGETVRLRVADAAQSRIWLNERGIAADMTTNGQLQFAAPDTATSDLIAHLAARGARIYEVVRRKPSLEDIFLKHMEAQGRSRP